MAEFLPAITYGLSNEGSKFTNNPNDPGGPTKYGICQRDHPGVDIENLTLADAEAIYHTQYWSCGGIQSQEVATKFLDWAINLEGTGRCGEAVKLLQQASNVQYPGVLQVDGKYGPNTELMVNRCDPDALLRDMIRFVLIYRGHLVDENPKLETFLKGWTLRDVRLPNDAKTATA